MPAPQPQNTGIEGIDLFGDALRHLREVLRALVAGEEVLDEPGDAGEDVLWVVVVEARVVRLRMDGERVEEEPNGAWRAGPATPAVHVRGRVHEELGQTGLEGCQVVLVLLAGHRSCVVPDRVRHSLENLFPGVEKREISGDDPDVAFQGVEPLVKELLGRFQVVEHRLSESLLDVE